MTDIDAPMRYAAPAADRSERDGSVGLVVLLALALAVAAVGLAVVSREMAEPFVLAILAGLAVIGVFCLFAAPSASCISVRARRATTSPRPSSTICRKGP